VQYPQRRPRRRHHHAALRQRDVGLRRYQLGLNPDSNFTDHRCDLAALPGRGEGAGAVASAVDVASEGAVEGAGAVAGEVEGVGEVEGAGDVAVNGVLDTADAPLDRGERSSRSRSVA
jgi:hypothetical protein